MEGVTLDCSATTACLMLGSENDTPAKFTVAYDCYTACTTAGTTAECFN